MIISLFSSGGGGTYDVKLGVALPSVSSLELVYDGTQKEPTIGSYSDELMTVTYTPQTNAGTYQVHCSLNDKTKYAWLNTISSADQDVPWTIAKANGTITPSEYSVEVGEDETQTVTVVANETTTFSAVSADTDVATVSVSGGTISITDGGTEGETTVTVSAADSNNYTYGSINISVVVQHLQIVTWSGGTDAQIAKMCEASDQGKLNLWDCWNIGDERTVALSAMAATGVGESHVAQNVTMVLMNAGGKILANGKFCAFVVGQKNVLAESGYMNSLNNNTGGWKGSARRTWCNGTYYNAIASNFKALLKQFINKSGTGGGSSSGTEEMTDWTALPAEVEVFGNTTHSVSGEGSQFKYYETSANRFKKVFGGGGSAYAWWTRSPYPGEYAHFCYVVSSGNDSWMGRAGETYRLAPFGCIGTANDGAGAVIPTWSDGTDEEISAAVASADAGNINLADFWNIGDKRAMSLSAMEATGVGESHRAQTVNLVLCDANNQNYTYVTPMSGRTYCNFVVQQENCLSSTDSGTTSDSELGYMNSSMTNSGSWNGCARRTWCNNVYRNAIPSSLRNIFKQVKVKTATEYNATTIKQSDDYFFLPAAAEVWKGDATYGTGGTAGKNTAWSNLTEFNALSRWQYYETTGNRVKKLGISGAMTYYWWQRSPSYNDTMTFKNASTDGTPASANANQAFGLAPAGCI